MKGLQAHPMPPFRAKWLESVCKDPVFRPHALDKSWGGGGGKRSLRHAVLLADSLQGRRGAGRDVYMYGCICLHVCRREGPGKLMPGVLFVVCFLRSSVAFTDDQYLPMTSLFQQKLCK